MGYWLVKSSEENVCYLTPKDPWHLPIKRFKYIANVFTFGFISSENCIPISTGGKNELNFCQGSCIKSRMLTKAQSGTICDN